VTSDADIIDMHSVRQPTLIIFTAYPSKLKQYSLGRQQPFFIGSFRSKGVWSLRYYDVTVQESLVELSFHILRWLIAYPCPPSP